MGGGGGGGGGVSCICMVAYPPVILSYTCVMNVVFYRTAQNYSGKKPTPPPPRIKWFPFAYEQDIKTVPPERSEETNLGGGGGAGIVCDQWLPPPPPPEALFAQYVFRRLDEDGWL